MKKHKVLVAQKGPFRIYRVGQDLFRLEKNSAGKPVSLEQLRELAALCYETAQLERAREAPVER
jgi:hypothetical protein